jgi:hypothetical protein
LIDTHPRLASHAASVDLPAPGRPTRTSTHWFADIQAIGKAGDDDDDVAVTKFARPRPASARERGRKPSGAHAR